MVCPNAETEILPTWGMQVHLLFSSVQIFNQQTFKYSGEFSWLFVSQLMGLVELVD